MTVTKKHTLLCCETHRRIRREENAGLILGTSDLINPPEKINAEGIIAVRPSSTEASCSLYSLFKL
jgi:hypothetical protein